MKVHLREENISETLLTGFEHNVDSNSHLSQQGIEISQDECKCLHFKSFHMARISHPLIPHNTMEDGHLQISFILTAINKTN